ncbi:hypothetical protein BN946_scf184999.g43 [Trametes cinnabarina]|uniref:Uncharacterized protein n=1 Tax=Pycnoporus cinnabarinus TaxID=5643 RepID=A0A060S7E2_PYCCI|nr:hypothetical protein BN946_scf184999.g43 [Trametes cinnabarina]
MNTPCIAILGTCDTKINELLYVRDRLINTGHVRVKLVDVGRTPSTHPAIDITQPTILAMSASPYKPSAPLDVSLLPRGELVKALSERAAPVIAALAATHELHGLIALGGSGGSALAAGVMRRLPLGFPKLLVSTMAAGDVGPFVGESDVAMLYSVVDIAGLNDILCPILDNAASAIAGMARAYQTRLNAEATASESPNGERKTKRIAITMFGVTTPAVTKARELLARYRCTPYIFHATGAGGRAMEALIEQGFFDGVLDLTTTELADELVGGVLSAGPHRLEAASRAGVPQVVSLGALDMVNFGPRASVPERFVRAGRRLHEHNSSVTLMRTTVAESEILGRIIAEKLMGAGKRAPTAGEKTEVWVPRGGVSVLDKQGQVFWDPDADDALVRALRRGLQEVRDDGHKIRVVEREEDINHPAFVEGMVQSLVQLMKLEPVMHNRSEDEKGAHL